MTNATDNMTDKTTQKPLIHFAHANGVPSKTYQKLFDLLSDDYEVIYLPVMSAHKGFAVDNHWTSLVEQLVYSIETQAKGRQVIGLGHSMGALTTFLASYRSPELFSQVIMMDPPMILGKKSFIFHMAKWFSPKTVDSVSPAGKSLNRRDSWPNRQAAYDQLRNKSLFKHFDETCFQAYIDHGLIDHPDGHVTLTIPVDSEVAVFRTNPSWFWLNLQPPKVPVQQLSGEDSQFIRYGFPQYLQHKVGVDYYLTKGAHMFPLEYPELTIARVKELIARVQ